MARPKVELDSHRDWITEAYQNATPLPKILDRLRRDANVSISSKSLYRRLQEWGVTVRQVRTQHTTSMEGQIQHLYYEYGLSDDAIYQSLVTAGHQISKSRVTKIRLSLEIYRRLPRNLVLQRQNELRAFFAQEQTQENIVQRFGRGSLYTHMRQRQFNLARDAIFQVYREFHDDAIKARLHKAHRRRGGWTTPGPNYIWSVDGHLKLAQYGFEIYAAIDAHSRFIPWFFVGHSALTARAIFAQYLHVVKECGFIPQIIRSDRGNETTMMAAAHYILSQRCKGSRFPRTHTTVQTTTDGSAASDTTMHTAQETLPWSECWCYGKSTQNQRIESWWNQLQENRTLFWRNYFGILKQTGLWNKDLIEDRIALLYVYMPIIRYETTEFVRLWNGHRIRRQRNRRHVVHGIPYQLYTMPNPADGFVDCRASLHEATWAELQHIADIDGIDLDEYLPTTTMMICEDLSSGFMGSGMTPNSLHRDTPYMHEYERLRGELRKYINSASQPPLTECAKPVGSWTELRERLRDHNCSLEGLDSLPTDNSIDSTI